MSPVRARFDAQRAAFEAEGAPSLAQRREHLRALLALLIDNEARFAAALSEDFGGRSPQETRLADVVFTVSAIRHAIRALPDWMRPERRLPHWAFWRARMRVTHQPLGVVGIVSPWNYPILLTLDPLTAALAAGNRAMLKPSEYVPRFSALLADLVAKTWPPERVTVVSGGPEIGEEFCHLPFDHLFFTGSTETGRRVAVAAASNLTPVTLELGGKSPVVIDPDFPIDSGIDAIMFGTLFNGGQSCAASDHVFVHEDRVTEFVAAARRSVAKLYPSAPTNPDYCPLLQPHHHRRLREWIEEAARAGAEVTELTDHPAWPGLKFPPTLVLQPPAFTALAAREIFGPVLPVVVYRTREEVLRQIALGSRPLFIHLFTRRREWIQAFEHSTTSGGLVVNVTLAQFCQPGFPIGGVGSSGMGRYHGVDGFRALSNRRGVYEQLRPNGLSLVYPPYDRPIWRKLLNFLVGRS